MHMNNNIKQRIDAIEILVQELKKHLETTTCSDAEMREVRKALKVVIVHVKRAGEVNRIGQFNWQPPLKSLPPMTPPAQLKKGLAYMVRVEQYGTHVQKIYIKEVARRDDDVLVTYDAFKPYYSDKGGGITFFKGKIRNDYMAQIPDGKKFIPGFPLGIFKPTKGINF